jgi:hypothetical protein
MSSLINWYVFLLFSKLNSFPLFSKYNLAFVSDSNHNWALFCHYVTDLEILSLSNTALEYSTGVVQEGDLNDLVHLTPLMNAPNGIHLFYDDGSNSRLHKRGDARTGSGSKRPRFTHLGDTTKESLFGALAGPGTRWSGVQRALLGRPGRQLPLAARSRPLPVHRCIKHFNSVSWLSKKTLDRIKYKCGPVWIKS